MATTVTNRETLDINFHVNDGTVTGSNYVWKLNNPVSGLTLNNVKDALGALPSSTSGWMAIITTNPLYTKDGGNIDGIDGATVVTTTITKNELS